VVARRLIAVLIVLLVLSSLAAALLPDPAIQDRSTTSATTTTTRAKPNPNRGRLVHAAFNADSAAVERVTVNVGDQLELRVRSTRSDEIEVRGFGEAATVDRFAPARFDLLAFDRGAFPVRMVEARRTVGTIVVRPRGASTVRPGSAAPRNGG
jgi:hypothetical protein